MEPGGLFEIGDRRLVAAQAKLDPAQELLGVGARLAGRHQAEREVRLARLDQGLVGLVEVQEVLGDRQAGDRLAHGVVAAFAQGERAAQDRRGAGEVSQPAHRLADADQSVGLLGLGLLLREERRAPPRSGRG